MIGRTLRRWVLAATLLLCAPVAVLADPGTTYLGSFGSIGSGLGQLGGPDGIATDDAGNVYVADTYNFRVQKFSPTGVFLASFGSLGNADGQFRFPYGIDVDAAGNVYVSDVVRGDVQKFSPAGAHLLTFGASVDEGFGLWVDDGSGVVYVADRPAQRVRMFSAATGAPVGVIGPVVGAATLFGPQNVEGDGAGHLYISDGEGAYRIVVTTLAGGLVRTFPDPAGGNPTGGAFASGRFFLSTYNLNVVTGVLESADVAIETLGDDEPVTFNSPLDCATFGDQLYVLDTGNGKVHRFQVNDLGTPPTVEVIAPDGGESFTTGATATLQWTAADDGTVTEVDLAISRDGGFTYGTIAAGIPNTGSYDWTVTGPPSASCRLRVRAHDDQEMVGQDASDADWSITATPPPGGPLAAVYIGSFGSFGSGPGHFGGPDGIATSDDGFVYVADTHNSRVQKFDHEGNHVDTFGTPGTGPGQFQRPYGIDVDDDGSVFVGDLDRGDVQKFSSGGAHLLTFGAFDAPFGLWVGDGVVYVTDRQVNRIRRYTTAGAPLPEFPSTFPQNIEGDGAGGLYVSQGTTPFQVTVMATDGGFVDELGEGVLANPTGTALAAGRLVITEYAEHRFRIWDPLNDLEVQTVTDAGPYTPMGAPIDCATLGDSLLFVVDAQQSRVHRYRLVATTAPVVAVVSPNGGESLEVGAMASLEWTATDDGTVTAIALELSRDGGATWTPLASGLPNTGSHSWMVTGPTSTQCLLRVIAEDDLGVIGADVSDAAWTIFAPPPGAGNFDFVAQFGQDLAGPNGIATSDDGKVYVADTYRSRVQVYDLDGAHLFDFGSQGSGPGQFQTPYGIDVDPAGNVYVSDFTLRRVQKFDAGGSYLATIDGPANLSQPLGLWVSDDGVLYVTDRTVDRVRRYWVDGTPQSPWGPVQDSVEIHYPQNIEGDCEGRLYVSEGAFPFRILVFAPSGDFLHAMSRPDSVNPTGGAFVGDHFLLTAYNLNRAYEIEVPGGVVDGVLHGFLSPLDAASSGDSVAFVLDTGNARVVKYRWTGSPPPQSQVVSPNGGEIFLVGDEVTVTWTASDDEAVTSVDLLLSRDGGLSYHPIAAGIPNTGTHEWTVTEPSSDECRLRVVAHDAGHRCGIDASDAVFSITGGPVATLVSMFRGAGLDGEIELRWALHDAASLASSTLERAPAATGPWAPVAAERRVEGATAIATDRDVTPGVTYWYRVVLRDGGGEIRSEAIAVAAGAPLELALALAPMPMRDVCRVAFALPRAASVRLTIHDVQGREVARVADGAFAAGRHEVLWTAASPRGPVAAGVYFATLRAAGERTLRKRLVIAP